jgi:hypothetical protein
LLPVNLLVTEADPAEDKNSKPNWVVVIVTLVGMFVGTLVAGLATHGNLLIHPSFEVAVAGDPQSPSIDKVQITNNGWVQTKNVQITVLSKFQSKIKDSRCDEAAIEPEANFTNSHKITMNRLSQNLACDVFFIPDLCKKWENRHAAGVAECRAIILLLLLILKRFQ